jgi:two-component system CheB/CheR fusion protein
LRAFRDFFAAVPPDVDMAFVVLQHLAPDYPSELADILQTATELTVREVADSPPLESGCVCVIPPGKLLSAVDGHLALREPTGMERRSLIDHFFRTLADAQQERSVAVVLSGMGSDGLSGLQRVKEVGGFTMAQAPEEAQFDSMPRSALASGMVDFCASARELAQELISLPERLRAVPLEPDDSDEAREAEALNRLFVQLRARTGYDFSDYKRSTISRRLRRRMQVLRVDTVAEYLDLLRADADEAHVLVKDFLISVTNFFRDPDAFEALLAPPHLPRLIEETPPGRPLRVWVPGCATGEEAYSLAILLCELADALPTPPPIQVFASDIDDEALAVAREGLYPRTIAGDVTAERLARFFRKEAGGYRVSPEVSEKILFAHHDLLEDPPFSRLDLVSCRNVLIYFNRTPQEQAFDTFHYALRDGGLLLLGSSESAKTFGKLFQVSDAENRIYRRNASAARVPRLSPRLIDVDYSRLPPRRPPRRDSAPPAAGDLHRRLLVALTAPPSVLVTQDYEVRHYEGEIGRVLRPASGDPAHHLLHMTPPEIRTELQSALFQAFRDDTEAHADAVLDSGTPLRITVRTVTPAEGGEQLALVLFDDRPSGAAAPPAPPTTPDEQQRSLVESLQADVAGLRQRLQTTVEEYEISGEELRASNEELQSINEETRSLAEELETSKEELQSTNEELATVNAELQVKVEELSRSKSDLENLMHATDIGTVFLDRSLALKRYTPRVTDLFHIIHTDVGRPFDHVSHRLRYDGLAADAAAVLDRLVPIRREV